LHAYDTFLTTQTRLFTLALSSFSIESTEIKQKQTLLVLDDLVVFAAMARRLIELTGLKQFSRDLPVSLALFDPREPKEVHKLKETVSFQRILNALIHASDIYFFNSRLDGMRAATSDQDVYALYKLFEKIHREKRWAEYSLPPVIFAIPDVGSPIMFCLSDLISSSIYLADKISEVCAESKIFLEFEYRGGS
jgi:hypothetical protein